MQCNRSSRDDDAQCSGYGNSMAMQETETRINSSGRRDSLNGARGGAVSKRKQGAQSRRIPVRCKKEMRGGGGG